MKKQCYTDLLNSLRRLRSVITEIRYQSSDADTHLYPNFDQFFLEPNVYHFNHDLSRSFKKSPLNQRVI